MIRDLRAIARVLGGEVSGAQVLAPGPGHGKLDRSLSVKLSATSPDGFLVHSFAGDDWRDCFDHVRERLGLSRINARQRPPIDDEARRKRDADRAPREARELEENDRRQKFALTLFDQAVDPHGTDTERYLNARKLELPHGADVIRHHPHCVFGADRVPCVVVLFRHNLTDEPLGVQRTRLPLGGWVRGAKMERLNLGPTGAGSIKIDADEDVLYGLTIGEGLETVLAGRMLGYRPAWATGGKGTIKALPGAAGARAEPQRALGA
jgi:putative DNA primase/helicase